ncbi:MAG: LacI family DNA-binding transcriptional regulator [Novosphingobium sp.]
MTRAVAQTGPDAQGKRPAQRKARGGASGPTVADVALMAGVSAMTVSRVVNDGASVSEHTRTRVQQAIDALGYVPNRAAQALAGGRQCKIALLHSNPSAAYLSEFLVGSLDQAARGEVQLVVEHCGEEPTALLVERLQTHHVDGVLLPPPLCDDRDLLQALHAAGLPLARIATGQPGAGAIAVTIDDEAAAHAMTRHLIAQGHTRIGFIEGNPNQSASALRRAGFERALRETGLVADPALIAAGDFSYRSGLSAAERLLTQTLRPTAVFAANDDMAAACVAVAHRLSLDVPRDLSVCGFDDSAMATTIWPELTTIRQPIATMAQIATEMLGAAVRGKGAAKGHHRLDFELVRRDSDGPAPKL